MSPIRRWEGQPAAPDGEHDAVPLRAVLAALLAPAAEPSTRAGLVVVSRRQDRIVCANPTAREVVVALSAGVSGATATGLWFFIPAWVELLQPGETRDLTSRLGAYWQSPTAVVATNYLDPSAAAAGPAWPEWRLFAPVFAGIAFGYHAGPAECLRAVRDGTTQLRASCHRRFDRLTLGFTDAAGARTVWSRPCAPDYGDGRYVTWFPAPPELALGGILRDVELVFGLAQAA